MRHESVYSDFADQGTNVRIDGCQYVYNLNSSAVGIGTYPGIDTTLSFRGKNAQAGETEPHVGYSPLPGAQIVPAALRAFQQAMPNVHVKLRDWSNEEFFAGVRDGRLQLALIVPPIKRGEFHDLRFEELARESVAAMNNRRYMSAFATSLRACKGCAPPS